MHLRKLDGHNTIRYTFPVQNKHKYFVDDLFLLDFLENSENPLFIFNQPLDFFYTGINIAFIMPILIEWQIV